MPRTGEALILASLTIVTTLVAGVAMATHRATWIEGISFVTGAVCVWLTVKESVWNFPVSLANVAAFLFVFARAKLYADAGLQVVYFILTAVGWYLWLYGGENRRELHVSRVPRLEAIVVAVCGLLITCGLTLYLRRVDDAAPFWDAFTTAISLAAQWLLNRKYLEMGQLEVVTLGRGFAWLDTGTHESLMQASNYIHAIEERQGLMVACIEEIAYRMGYITAAETAQLARAMGSSAYGQYLTHMLEHEA